MPFLSARPEDRRAVIEEAAGISKHRRRKEKAERRLEATEGALLRAQDLLKEVRRQLRPLERQAEAARRHAEVMAELTALRRYLYGRELALLRSRLGRPTAARADLTRAEEGALATLAALDYVGRHSRRGARYGPAQRRGVGPFRARFDGRGL